MEEKIEKYIISTIEQPRKFLDIYDCETTKFSLATQYDSKEEADGMLSEIDVAYLYEVVSIEVTFKLIIVN